ncbi:SAICAR synthase-like protein [Rhizodiscina lignyota]|uniref:Kinase n=1 Tax=Rhizodiscina lignyota TaxID=1504668 RepID=A0A9P4MAJ3_9PEZI|nr:SAICAR synthase-like protein [Rhizodiscina lignyota]
MPKPSVPIDADSLVAYNNVAAGHEGVLSDASGALVIKPCTQAEVSFYESAAAEHPAFAQYMPTFMGTLTRATSSATATANGTAVAESGDRLHGKPLDTDLHIVMEDVAAGFTKPNILDVKLGARLWDDDAPAAKRARLDDVAARSTSGSLGFRIAGMKVWGRGPKVEKGGKEKVKDEVLKEGEKKADMWEYDEDSGYTKYTKFYGRNFITENVADGFREYIGMPCRTRADAEDNEQERAQELLSYFTGELRGIQEALENEESRMYSASILFVYEGDPEAYEATKAKLAAEVEDGIDEEMDDEYDDDEELGPKLAAVKLIDFAHARWTPGKGRDENALQGVRSMAKVLEDLLDGLGTA